MTTTPTIWTTFLANSAGTAGVQRAPRSIGLANGNILVVWDDDTFGPSTGRDIVGRIFDPLGNAVAAQFQLNSAQFQGEQTYPKIAALPDGGFVMAYGSHSPSGVDFLTVERFDSAGVSVAADLITNATIQSPDDLFFANDSDYEIAVNAQGDYTLAFTVKAGDDRDVHAFVYNHATNARGPEHVNTVQNGEDDDYLHGIATFANGDIIAVSNEEDSTFLGGPYQTAEFRITSATGANLVSHTEVGGSTDHNAEADGVAVLTGGKFVVLYHYVNYATDQNDPIYYAMRIGSRDASNHVTLSQEIKLSQPFDSGDLHYVVRASVVALPDGGFFVAWAEFGTNNIVGTRYSSTGTIIGNQASQIANDNGNYVLGELSLTSDGRILLPYTNNAGEISEVILDPRDTFIVGTDAADVLTTQTTASVVFGEGGNDRIYGREGEDFLNGGTGNDTITGGAGRDLIHGDDNNDSLYGDQDDDSLFGDAGNDFLDGGPGRDTLNGGAGADTLAGGLDDDSYVLATTHLTADGKGGFVFKYDTVTEAVNTGLDTVFVVPVTGFGAVSSYTLTANVENGVIQGTSALNLTGTDLDNGLTGNAAANTIDGAGGNDILDGGAGADSLIGGLGNDTFVLGADTSDTVGDAGGVDLITSTVTRSLADFGSIENLILLGADPINGTGNGLNNLIIGNAAANILDGGDGDDTLIGDASDNARIRDASDDTLIGGLGNDTFVLADGGDGVTDSGGVDTITSTITRSLAGDDRSAGYATIENLTLLGANPINGTGNSLANTITGNAAANMLRGLGGNDTYFVDNAGDKVIEAAGGGYDTVNTTLNVYTLGANVERVNFTGAGNFIGLGNALDNRFAGSAGDDRFVTSAGADIYGGGLGTDAVDYRTATIGAVLNFSTGAFAGAAVGDIFGSIEKFFGSDTAGDTMTGAPAGRFVFAGFGGNDRLTGGGTIDQLQGGAGNDTLAGLAGSDSLDGGAGNDTMTGGTGADLFVYSAAGFGKDTITDFEDGQDKFKVNSSVADAIGDYTITGNGSANVTLALVTDPNQTIAVHGSGGSNLTIAVSDFAFY